MALLGLTALGATACSSSKNASPTTRSTASADHELRAVLDDTGLHLPAGPIDAAEYRISFTDQRSHPPAGQKVTLGFRPSGPDITLLEVPAGQTLNAALLSNLVAYVAIDGKDARVAVDHQLDIVATPQYPTPAT